MKAIFIVLLNYLGCCYQFYSDHIATEVLKYNCHQDASYTPYVAKRQLININLKKKYTKISQL